MRHLLFVALVGCGSSPSPTPGPIEPPATTPNTGVPTTTPTGSTTPTGTTTPTGSTTTASCAPGGPLTAYGLVGQDWTSGLLFEADPTTGVLVVDPATGNLVAIPQAQWGACPTSMYVRTYAYWYDDFLPVQPTAPGPTGITPTALGFEIEGMLLSDGRFGEVRPDAYSSYPANLKLKLADAEFFTLGAADQAGHFCTVTAVLDPEPTQDDLVTADGADVWWTWELTVDIAYHDCAGVLDPSVWGANAEQVDILYQGLELGLAMGPMTPYLEQAWDAQSLQDYDFYALYIAVDTIPTPWAP